MRKIYINEDTADEIIRNNNGEMTPFSFKLHLEAFLHLLLSDPVTADVDDCLKGYGITRENLIHAMVERNMIVPEKKITSRSDENGKESDQFTIKYNIPKKNYERNVERLYQSLFEENIIEGTVLDEDGAMGGCGCAMSSGALGGVTATSTVSADGAFDSAGYVKPVEFGKKDKENKKESDVMRRKIYVTEEQANSLLETTTADTGNYQYEVPFEFNNGNDEAYDHRGMMASGWNCGKKKGIRKKRNV